jgi:hypothetical protein
MVVGEASVFETAISPTGGVIALGKKGGGVAAVVGAGAPSIVIFGLGTRTFGF